MHTLFVSLPAREDLRCRSDLVYHIRAVNAAEGDSDGAHSGQKLRTEDRGISLAARAIMLFTD